MRSKIAIIGAGPAGSIAAKRLAENGFEVQVFEEHPEIGKPVQCTGIVTNEIEGLLKLAPEAVVNRISTTRIFSPEGKFIEINHRKSELVLDRAKFDKSLALSAENSGAEYGLGCRFADFEKKGNIKIKIIRNDKIIFKSADILIGADGCLSRVAKSAGLFGSRKFFTGMQAVVKLENENKVETYLIEKGFGWVVPENRKRARIGVVSSYNPSAELKKLLERKLGKNYEKRIVSRQAGLVPVYSPKTKIQTESIYLVGDAAAAAKAATAGGIMQAVIGAQILAESIITGKDYEKAWRKRAARELYFSLIIRKILDKFREKDYNYLVSLFSKEKNRKILENYSRETPSKMILRLAVSEPGLFRFLKFLV